MENRDAVAVARSSAKGSQSRDWLALKVLWKETLLNDARIAKVTKPAETWPGKATQTSERKQFQDAPRGSWAQSKGPITADGQAKRLAAEINSYLTEPAAVLPSAADAVMRPFIKGMGSALHARRRPQVSSRDLAKAVRVYTSNASYLLAAAQPDSMRHDIDGAPVEPVNEEDRDYSRKRFLEIMATKRKARADKAAASGNQPPDRTGSP